MYYKVEISNAHHLCFEPITEDTKIIKPFRDNCDGFVELQNGAKLHNMGDGRYYGFVNGRDDEDELWCEVLVNEYDENDEIDQGELIGFTKI